jgi:ornithine--oxo-acid transaminase
VIDMLRTGESQANSAEQGAWLLDELRRADLATVTQIRGRGLWVGIDLAPSAGTAREACERLVTRGILAKDTHVSTIRLAPPLVIERGELEWSLERLLPVLSPAA